MAANSVNFGKPVKLNCAEALAAALYITSFDDVADALLSSFQWGSSFYEINKELFELYKQCTDPASVLKVQEEYLDRIRQEHQDSRNQIQDENVDEFGIPIESSSEDEQEDGDEELEIKMDSFGNTIE